MEHVLETVNSCGEYDRLIQGVFENFLKQKMQDPNMEGIVEANRWFCFDDRVQNKINSVQNYAIYPYLVFGFVSWHFSFSSMTYPQILYPHKQFEVSQKTSTTKLIFGNLKKGISSTLRGIGSGTELLLDSVSLVKLIISPEIRSVSMHLLSEKEKIEMKHTVDVIADLGLTFNQLQGHDGTYTYRVEPDIEYLSGNFSETHGKQMSYWSKQVIAREVELEKMRRAKPKVSQIENRAAEKKQTESPGTSKALPNHLQRLIPKAIQAKPALVVS
jgi:chromosome transmission fidelity protein 18